MDSFDFDKDVIQDSAKVPIVVDFWAPWCGPCKFLGPVIEELASAADNWKLVKVNTDEHPELMQKYQIRGIPAVKMFRNGEVIAEFTGALPKHQIEKWVDQHLPDPRKELLDQIRIELESGDKEQGQSRLEDFVKTNPGMEEGHLLLAELKVWEDPSGAAQLVEQIRVGNELFDRAQNIRDLSSLWDCNQNQSDVSGMIDKARSSLETGNLEDALVSLLEAVKTDKTYCKELPRRATISIFNLLGPSHNLTLKYRRSFDMALY